MKITIATLANKRPDFIELQYRTIQRYVEDADVEYIVFNNACNDRRRFDAIESICRKLNVRSIAVKGEDNGDVSQTVAYSLNAIWREHLSKITGLLTIIDSDMFFIKSIRIENLMQDYDFGFVPNYRGAEFEIMYPWTGLMFFNMDTLPEIGMLRFDVGEIGGHRVDVGGLNHYYLKKHWGTLRILYLEMWNLEDTALSENGTKTLKCALNGNARFVALLDSKNAILEIETKDPHIGETRSFPYQKDQADYYKHLTADFLRFEALMQQKDFPHPFWADVFKTADADFSEAFVFHYKSGSNWLPFYTEQYNAQKTEALVKFLGIDAKTLIIQKAEFYKPTETIKAVLAKYLVKAKKLTQKMLAKSGLSR